MFSRDVVISLCSPAAVIVNGSKRSRPTYKYLLAGSLLFGVEFALVMSSKHVS